MPVEVLDHPADIRLRVSGHSFPSALLELLNYTLGLMYGPGINPEIIFDFTVEFETLESLVPRIVNEAIFRAEATETAGRIRRVTVCGNKAAAQYIGERMTEGKRYGSMAVKAATYDRLFVSENPPVIEITLDI
ncbi:MAG: archease [Thermoplasmata archaeon]